MSKNSVTITVEGSEEFVLKVAMALLDVRETHVQGEHIDTDDLEIRPGEYRKFDVPELDPEEELTFGPLPFTVVDLKGQELGGGENDPGNGGGLSFVEAIDLAMQGFRVRRPMWDDNTYIWLPADVDDDPMNLKMMCKDGTTRYTSDIIFTDYEVDATDWEVVL